VAEATFVRRIPTELEETVGPAGAVLVDFDCEDAGACATANVAGAVMASAAMAASAMNLRVNL
jgi:hypothetical protein